MKNLFHIVSLFAVAFLLCGSMKAQDADSLAVPADTVVLPMASGYDWITYRGKADITDTGGTRTCNFYMVNRTDSILYLNIHAFSVEIMRAVFTPDSVKYVNKLTQQYFCDTYAPINKYLSFDFDFQTVQALFNGETEKLPQGKKLSFEYSAFTPVDSTSSFFTEFVFKELNRVMEINGKIKVIRLNVPGVTSIKIPEKFERITL
ncbi:MAG: DUF4292 domain-containing protein [Bacteroidales bacterium]|nr:DUF4292 domain-containing protein [Bacteroidales bacterium]